MSRKLLKRYKLFLKLKQKKIVLRRFFDAYLPEVVYRSTKIEHGEVSHRDILRFLK